MNVREVMTSDPACCSPGTPLPQVARLMVENDCVCIPVVDDHEQPIGVITDRDICCRAVAEAKDPRELTARDCMSDSCVTVTPETSVEDCCALLEDNQIRRAVVVDEQGRCCGIVAQSDIALHERALAGEVVQAVSQPSDAASTVAASGARGTHGSSPQPGRGGCC